MTADSGYIKVWFSGDDTVMDGFSQLVANTDRQNLFSCGLSWLDELDFQWEAEADCISYDSIEATRDFLSQALAQLPGLSFEGDLEHCWPTLPCKVTRVSFSSDGGRLCWEESVEAAEADPEEDDLYDTEQDEDDIFIPLTPYD